MNKQEVLMEAIKNLLQNRDFLGLQLDFSLQNIKTDEYIARSEKYLDKEGSENMEEKVKFLKESLEVDSETIATMLDCEDQVVEDILNKEKSDNDIWDVVDMPFKEGMSLEAFRAEIKKFGELLDHVVQHMESLDVSPDGFSVESFVEEDEDVNVGCEDWIPFVIRGKS